jgi:hypothetical protein
MKRTSILAIFSALALPVLGDDLKITVIQHSPTEVAAAAMAGFNSVEEFYADLNRNLFLPAATKRLKETWASLTPEQQRFLHKPQSKWWRWYKALPSKTPRDIVRLIAVVENHTYELEAWLPENLRTGPPKYAPGTSQEGSPDGWKPPPTMEELGTPLPQTPGGPPTARELGTPR